MTLKPNTIKVFASETVRTTEDHFTKQGYGYSAPLEKPETCISYGWQADLHGQKSVVSFTFNTRSSLEELAKNLVDNMKANPSPAHNKAGIPAYALSYDAPNKEYRQLTPVEMMQFFGAFQRAMKKE